LTSASAQIANANVTNLSAANFAPTNVLTTNISSATLNISTGLTSASAQIINVSSTNVSSATIRLSTGLTSASALITNVNTTNITLGSAFISGTSTTGSILISNTPSGNQLQIDAQGSTTNIAQLIFTGSAGTGDFKIAGDGGDVQWQGGGGRALQMGAFHGIQLLGGRNTTSPIAFTSGSGAAFNTLVQNTNNSLGLIVRGSSTQTNDLQQWQSSTGTTVANVSSGGDIFNNGFLLYGRDHFFAESAPLQSSSSLTYQTVITATTGSFSGGTYAVLTSYVAGGGANTGRFLQTRTIIDGSQTAATGSTPLINASMGIPIAQYSLLNLSSGVHTVLLDFRTSNTGTAATIRNSTVWLFRVE
jgi:hypothetical protein